MASARAGGTRRKARFPLPTGWELWELSLQLVLLPLVFLPRRMALAACRAVAAALLRPGSAYRRQMEALLPASFAELLAPGGQGALNRSEVLLLYDRVLVLRGVLLPWWKGRVRVGGVEHVETALEAGHGAILWAHPCLGSHLWVKQGLFEAGYPLAHLTRPPHGFSPHAFGMRFINPLLRRPEDRWLAERVVIDDGNTFRPLRRLRALLHENRVVSITVTTAASRLHEFPFMGGVAILPTGPVELAASTGAALLPVFTVGSEPTPLVQIGPPLQVAGTGMEAVRHCQQANLDWLQERIGEYPLDWLGWRMHLFRGREGEEER